MNTSEKYPGLLNQEDVEAGLSPWAMTWKLSAAFRFSSRWAFQIFRRQGDV